MNRYQDENWQQEEQRRREAYYRMNSQNSNTPDALEQIFRGPLNWMNLLLIGINVVIFIVMEFLGSTEAVSYTHLDVYKRQGNTGRKSRSRMER